MPPKLALPIIENASLEDSDELQDLWANLLASALDPTLEGKVRSAFIDIIRQLEIVDVHILSSVYTINLERNAKYEKEYGFQRDILLDSIKYPIAEQEIIEKLRIKSHTYENSVDNLIRLRLVSPYVEESEVETEVWDRVSRTAFTYVHDNSHICITSFGVSFVQVCTNESFPKGNYEI